MDGSHVAGGLGGCQATMEISLFALKTPELKPCFWRANTQRQRGHTDYRLCAEACAALLRFEWLLSISTNQGWGIARCAPPLQNLQLCFLDSLWFSLHTSFSLLSTCTGFANRWPNTHTVITHNYPLWHTVE